MNVKKKRKWKGKNWTEKNCRRNTSNYTQNEENHSKWKDFINSIFVKRKTQLEKIIKKRRKKYINHPNKYTLIGSKSTKKLRTWIPCKQHAFENWFICIVCIVIWVVEWLQRFCSILLAYTFAFQFSVKNISLFWLSTFFCASHLNISSQFHPNENWNGKLSCCRYNKEIARISWIH